METSKFFIGIDSSHQFHMVSITSQDGDIIDQFAFDNDLAGFNKFIKRLATFKDIYIGFEIAHGPLVDFLRSNNFNAYSVNPLKIKRYKQTHSVAANKSDEIDAKAIAFYLKDNYQSLRPMKFNSPEIEELKHLCTIHDQLKKEIHRTTMQLLDSLKLYFPLYSHLFSSSTVPILLHFVIKYPSWKDLQNTSDDELIKFLYSHHYPGKDVKKLLSKIHNYSQVISSDVEKSYSIKAITLAQSILILKVGIKTIESKMLDITKQHRLGEIFLSIPGSGDILSPKLLAIFGDNKSAFENYNNAQCYFGTAPKNYQSGKMHKVIMRRACNKQGRNILYQLAFSSMNFSEWAKEYYYRQRTKGKTNSMALRALSNKWVKVIYYLWLNEKLYSKNKHKSEIILPAA